MHHWWSCLVFIAFLGLAPPGEAKIRVEPLPYSQNQKTFQGVLAWDDSVKGKRPGILVVHEWWGLNEYATNRAKQLAELGYVALAVDMYGEGRVTVHGKEAGEWAKQVTSNIDDWQKRAMNGIHILQADARVDADRLAAIGFCFGGATVMQMVYGGAPVRGVVSFHGSLPLPANTQNMNRSAKVFVAHGGSDPFLSSEHIAKFTGVLDEAGIDWQMSVYGGAQHSFTNPSADQYGMKGVKYHPEAATRSWAQMKIFFDEIFQ